MFNKYKQQISSFLHCSPEQIFLYWKGRVALYAVLKAMGIKEGDEVIIPAFTCVVVPNAIIYLKAKPIYVDINSETYNADVTKIENSITNKTKVIICQNTFGLSSNVEKINEIAKLHNLYTIEDCTHGFGGFYNGKPNGSYCDAAFYSTQWNKPFSTGIGGFLVVNNQSLLEKVNSLEKEKVKPGFIDQFYLLSLLTFHKLMLNDYTYWSFMKLYRVLSKYNLVIGSNRGEELSGTEMPENYFKDISIVQVKAGTDQLKHINRINSLRKKNAASYTAFLKKNNKIYVDDSLFDNHLFLKYPIQVKDRDRFIEKAEKNRIKLGDWFLSPIHPVKENYEQWNLNPEMFPCANNISKYIVNLPTDVDDTTRVFNFLEENLNDIK